MSYTKTEIRDARKKLSDEAVSFADSSEIIEIISEHLKKIGFTEDQSDQADSEILYAMYGLQTLDDAIKNISTITQKPIESLDSLKTKLKENIFDKLEEIKKNFPTRIEEGVAPVSNNLPVVEAGEVAHDVPHVEHKEAPTISQVATPEPVEPQKAEVKPKVNHYPDGKDPYREPLE